MDDALTPAGSPTRDEAPVDLSVLEGIEGELQAVERALEQIDQGVYDGFPGLDVATSGPPEPVEAAESAGVAGDPAPADDPVPPVGSG